MFLSVQKNQFDFGFNYLTLTQTKTDCSHTGTFYYVKQSQKLASFTLTETIQIFLRFLPGQKSSATIFLPQDMKNTGKVLPHGEKVPLWPCLVGYPSSNGVTIKMPYGGEGGDVLHRPASHPIFSYWVD